MQKDWFETSGGGTICTPFPLVFGTGCILLPLAAAAVAAAGWTEVQDQES